MDDDDNIPDYQTTALFGNAPNTSAINAQTLNPAASSPNDWTTVLTNGISGAAIAGINGAVNNAVQAGALQNAITAKNAGLTVGGAPAVSGFLPILIIGAIIFMAVK